MPLHTGVHPAAVIGSHECRDGPSGPSWADLKVGPYVLFLLFALAPRPALAQTDVSDADLEHLSAGRTVALGSPAAGGRVTIIPIEIYVARVLAGEAERDAPEAELQALAVAIRTFTIFNTGRHHRDGYDLCDTTHCQVPRTATAATRRAARATAGRILTYKGSAAEIYYSASCGGRSERADAVWPGANLPYLVSVTDDVHEDDQEWTLQLSLQQIQEALRASGFEGTRLTDVRIEERSESGRVATLRLRGLQPDVIAGQPFRLAIGPTRLRSTAFSITRRGDVVQFTGRGYGHGVGLCVIGAGRRARRGESADEILAKYYPGLRITTLDHVTPPAPIETAVAPPKSKDTAIAAPNSHRAAAIPAPAATGIVVRVPRGSNVSATDLERMAVHARDTLSQSLGTSLTPITIVLHETMDRFREATGRPWWVSWVAGGTTIELSPAPVLDQRDGVEAAVTQAIAELFVAPSLADRPAWVRVGAAHYFAKTPHPTAPRSKVRCPSDAELTLAISAAAQRDADARAEACFARAYVSAKDWRAVH